MHEVTHARRRDNLIGLIHEIALCLLWFHPLVWLTGLRLAMFKELSCDDSVIESSRGADLVTALAKLAVPGESRLLRAGAATLFRHRLARLKAPPPYRTRGSADLALILVYGAVLLACMVETIAHTPGLLQGRHVNRPLSRPFSLRFAMVRLWVQITRLTLVQSRRNIGSVDSLAS